jgi:hypothetical protein
MVNAENSCSTALYSAALMSQFQNPFIKPGRFIPLAAGRVFLIYANKIENFEKLSNSIIVD